MTLRYDTELAETLQESQFGGLHVTCCCGTGRHLELLAESWYEVVGWHRLAWARKP